MIKKSWSKLTRPVAIIGLCCATALSLQGCVEMVVGSAVIGTFAATDRRTFGAQTDDKAIVIKGETRVSRLLGKNGHVDVNSFNRRVLLTGEVVDENAKQAAEREMRAIDGVVSVTNELMIAQASDLSSRSNDALLTTKVKATFVDAKDVSANAFKVVTEAGVVYLMGRVTQGEGSRAADLTSSISGVRKVVKVFEYISEAELKEYQRTPSKQTNNSDN
ncbi:BON domain-containing protein [Undibacterium sp. TS12]|uniref:BON domain-containing protein n=1 Tax=Undibacterium sp. TS12 TaxID=2908202 RepID=UPI001F4D1BCF|nr:BON domain-containing protein [Undibacterium sp. TS12]MCH8621124.1 BON domain-containing protein [Undibacterium sp. TS12]